MNNLVFNTVASQLKTSIYGYNATTSQYLPIQLDSTNNLLVSGSLTVSNSVTIANTSLTVGGTVTVGNSVTIANTSLTVGGTVTVGNSVTIANASLTVDGSVTVSNSVTIANTTLTVGGTVTVGNATITALVGGCSFTSLTLSSQSITGTTIVFSNTDISQMKNASFLLYNPGTATLTLSLQYSATQVASDYINDPSYTNFTIPATSNLLVSIAAHAHYVQLQANMSTTTGTISGYYNAQA